MISVAVEGDTDEAVVRRIARDVGIHVGNVYGRRGRPHLLSRLPGYNDSARHRPWLVLADLDRDPCVGQLLRDHLPSPANLMRFRVAVHAIEAWLLADRVEMAAFMGVSIDLIPRSPDTLMDPKQELVNIARRARRRRVREDVVPRPNSGRQIGPGYVAQLTEFVETNWTPHEARRNSASLARCMDRMQELTCSRSTSGGT